MGFLSKIRATQKPCVPAAAEKAAEEKLEVEFPDYEVKISGNAIDGYEGLIFYMGRCIGSTYGMHGATFYDIDGLLAAARKRIKSEVKRQETKVEKTIKL